MRERSKDLLRELSELKSGELESTWTEVIVLEVLSLSLDRITEDT